MGKIYCRAKIFKRKIETKCVILRLEVGQVGHNRHRHSDYKDK